MPSEHSGDDEVSEGIDIETSDPPVRPRPINPTDMQGSDSLILGRFLAEHSDELIFLAHKKYNDEINETESFRLTHSVLCRKQKEGAGSRYEVLLNEPIRVNTNSEIYLIAGTLVLQRDQTVVYKSKPEDKKRVVKTQDHVKRGSVEEIIEKYEVIKNIPHIHMKAPTIVVLDEEDQHYISYRVMRCQSGVPLSLLITQDRDPDLASLETEERFELSLALLKALQEQVHDHGIVHRDLSPQNIIVNIPSKITPDTPIQVGIIDFDLCKKMMFDDREQLGCGTPGYIPFESFVGEGTDEKSDLFSIGINIGCIWKADLPSIGSLLPELLSNCQNHKFNNLGVGLKIDEEIKSGLLELLLSMIKRERDERPSVTDAIEKLTDIYARWNKISEKLPGSESLKMEM